MRRLSPAIAFVVLATTALAQSPAQPWTQVGGGPGHHGYATLQEGALDVVSWYTFTQPGEITQGMIETPHGLAGFAYGGSVDFTDDTGTGECAFYRIPDPSVNESIRVPTGDTCASVLGMLTTVYEPATDGVTRCIGSINGAGAMAFHDARTGEERWRVTAAQLGAAPDPQVRWACGFPAVGPDASIYVPLYSVPYRIHVDWPITEQPNATFNVLSGGYLAKVDAATGSVLWSSKLDEAERQAPSFLPDVRPDTRPTGGRFRPTSVTLTETGVVVSGAYVCACVRPDGSFVALEGALTWLAPDGRTIGSVRAGVPTEATAERVLPPANYVSNYGAASRALAAFAFAGDVALVNPADAALVKRVPIDAVESSSSYIGTTGPAWSGDRLVVPLSHSVTAFDAGTLERTWSWTDGPQWDAARVLIGAPSDVYILNARILGNSSEGPALLVRLALDDGRELQRIRVPVPASRVDGRWPATILPRADGSALLESVEGHVVVFGRADGALLPDAQVSDPYPDPGETIEITLGASDAVELNVSWDDGAIESATAGSTLAHRYEAPGARTVRIAALHPDGRTATREIALVVGGTPPPDTILGKAFARENQDVTFGTLGVLLTIVGFLVALYVRRRRRSVLDEELRGLELLRELAARDPAAGSRELCALRQRFRRDLAEGRLDDSQFSLLDDRLGNLLRGARRRLLLPFVGRASIELRHLLDASLEDGHLTSAEASAVLARLPQERELDDGMRRALGELLRSWRAEEEALPARR